LLIAVKLLSGILEHRPAGDGPAAAVPAPDADGDRDAPRDQARPGPLGRTPPGRTAGTSRPPPPRHAPERRHPRAGHRHGDGPSP
jgi:hypothetical protein